MSTIADVQNFILEFLFEPNLRKNHEKQLGTILFFQSELRHSLQIFVGRNNTPLYLHSTSLCDHVKLYRFQIESVLFNARMLTDFELYSNEQFL